MNVVFCSLSRCWWVIIYMVFKHVELLQKNIYSGLDYSMKCTDCVKWHANVIFHLQTGIVMSMKGIALLWFQTFSAAKVSWRRPQHPAFHCVGLPNGISISTFATCVFLVPDQWGVLTVLHFPLTFRCWLIKIILWIITMNPVLFPPKGLSAWVLLQNCLCFSHDCRTISNA